MYVPGASASQMVRWTHVMEASTYLGPDQNYLTTTLIDSLV